MIRESVAFLKEQGRRVIYDAEHFFDGYALVPQYALETLRAALAATGGTALPPRGDIVRIMRRAAPGGMEGESTFTRRASTVRGWTSWLLDMCRTLPGTFRAF